jgi:hypothetical protein
MTRSIAIAAICCVLVLAAAGCTGGGGNHRGAKSPGKTPVRTSVAVGRPQSAILALPAGRSSAQFRITAPSPAQYEFDVTVSAPASADIGVSIHTWYGAILPSILDSTHDQAWFQVRGLQETCFEQFPLLPAQRAGTWSVVASKRSEPAAKVRVAVVFAKPSG